VRSFTPLNDLLFSQDDLRHACVFSLCAELRSGNHAERFQRHQDQELVAEANIDLTATWDDRPQRATYERNYIQANDCYKEGVKELLPETDNQCGGVLLPTNNDLDTILQEMSAGVAQRVCPEKKHCVHQRTTVALEKFEEGIRLIEGEQSRLSIHSSQHFRNARLLTRLKAFKRQAEQMQIIDCYDPTDDCFAQVIDPWERNRDVLDGDWETSGGIASRSSNFPKFKLIRSSHGRKIEHGYIRCAICPAIGTGNQSEDEMARKWTNVKELAKPKQVVVRVYVIEGIKLRAMDINGSSDPYVIATLSGEKQLKQGDRSLHKKATLNPEFRQARATVRLPSYSNRYIARTSM
jgi:hypothetical protein